MPTKTKSISPWWAIPIVFTVIVISLLIFFIAGTPVVERDGQWQEAPSVWVCQTPDHWSYDATVQAVKAIEAQTPVRFGPVVAHACPPDVTGTLRIKTNSALSPDDKAVTTTRRSTDGNITDATISVSPETPRLKTPRSFQIDNPLAVDLMAHELLHAQGYGHATTRGFSSSQHIMSQSLERVGTDWRGIK